MALIQYESAIPLILIILESENTVPQLTIVKLTWLNIIKTYVFVDMQIGSETVNFFSS